jgi:hypothetical protein
VGERSQRVILPAQAVGPEKAPGSGTAGQERRLNPATQAPVAAGTDFEFAIEQAGQRPRARPRDALSTDLAAAPPGLLLLRAI